MKKLKKLLMTPLYALVGFIAAVVLERMYAGLELEDE